MTHTSTTRILNALLDEPMSVRQRVDLECALVRAYLAELRASRTRPETKIGLRGRPATKSRS